MLEKTATSATRVVTTTDIARVGDRVVRVFASLPCPHCLRGRLRATSMQEVGEGEYVLRCQRCHVDILTVTHD